MRFLRSFTFAVVVFLCIWATYNQSHSTVAQAQSSSVVTDTNPTFTTIDVPGAGYTGVTGINTAGDMVGNYGQNTNVDSHGFKYSNATFTYFDYPGGQNETVPQGINDSGLISGYAGKNPVVGFVYDGTTFTTLRDDGDSASFARGNNAGVVVGGAGTIYTTKGFEMRGGTYKTLQVPGQYVYVEAAGVNSLAVIVGFTDYDGFVCRHDSCRIIDFPGASQTVALGISESGTIVGLYFTSACMCAFASKDGKYISFSYPGAALTEAAGINSSGQIVGAYTFDFQAYHGFVASPLTPANFQ